ncbi:Predicted lipid-binding transport protein, Tim44 family [Marinospirillum celere]|uniref:Predicted lipid-binding transport protein, Tim44 family n=1 Tax=Marinospirillum celere TaxID=1122252 RepID=A0A1I1HE02_9GAMM|nr:TIM44-like domain-containing protein [Marinospirillum celere]SFC22399.1 Predicted lipid-binding transport protein, Tim44 family [Marinospirillum celere]
MTRFLALGLSCMFVLALGISEADARRMGGGGSGGTFSRQASPPAQQQQQRQQTQQQQQGQQSAAVGRGGLMGPLMGLAAGGLLAAMFFGGAFDGIQFFDILILLLIGAGVFMFLRSRAQRHQQQAQVAGSMQRSAPPSAYDQKSQAGFEAFDRSAASVSAEPEIRFGAPDWFDEQGFLARAKQHFIDLQAAWDANDFRTLEEFVTPQLYRFLQEERARQPGEVKTDVKKLAVEVSNIQQIGDTVELAVMFHGIISESGAPEAPFCEIWHLIRDMSEEQSPWLIQGIEQVE